MSGPVPMSPSTAPDSTASQGSAASAPAGMVSGNEEAVHAGTTPVYNIADPLQGSGDPWASTTPWLSFSPPAGTQSGFQQHHCLTGSLGATGQES